MRASQRARAPDREDHVLSDLPLGPIAERAREWPAEPAIIDDHGVRTWSQVEIELRQAASAMLATAPDPDARWGVLGDNAGPTLLAHAAGLIAGVGTVAIARQRTLRELADQIEDAGIVGLITGPGGAAVGVEAMSAGLVAAVVVHSGALPTDAPSGVIAWDTWLASAPERSEFPERPARAVMVYTSGTTGRARGTETRWVLAQVETSRDYLRVLRERAQFPPGPHIVVGPLQHTGPLAAVRHLLPAGPVVLVGRLDAARPLQQAAAVVLPLLMVAWWQRVDVRHTFRLEWPGGATGHEAWWRGIGSLVGAALVGAAAFVIGATALLAVKGTALSAEGKLLSEKILALMQGQPAWVSWGLMAVLPAICEELLFRGWVLSGFEGKAGSVRRVAAAIVAQAVLFAIFHLLPERMPQTFFLGIVLGWMTHMTGSLLPAIVCHLVHNSMPLVVLATGLPPWSLPAAVGCAVVGAACLATAVRARPRKEPFP